MAVFGVGGLGVSAVQLAKIMGAGVVYAVDVIDRKLALAERFGAVAIKAGGEGTSADVIMKLTSGPVEVIVMWPVLRSMASVQPNRP